MLVTVEVLVSIDSIEVVVSEEISVVDSAVDKSVVENSEVEIDSELKVV